jgi:hypothetical protein
LKPVYLDDVLQFKAVIVKVSKSVKAIEFKFAFVNKDFNMVSKGKIQIGILG